MKLGPGMANVLTAQTHLADSLGATGRVQTALEARLSTSQRQLDAIDGQLERLDNDIQQTDSRVKDNKAEVSAIARALYMQPSSLLVQVAAAGGPREAVTATGDLLAAAGRAEALQKSLEADRTRLQAERDQRKQARDEQARALYEQSGALDQLRGLLQQQRDTGERLAAVLLRAQAALASTGGENTALGLAVADQIRFDEQALIAEAMREAWTEASLWARLNHTTPPPLPSAPASSAAATTAVARPDSHGSLFIWPEQQTTITQGFGPTDLWFEPSFGGFPHFHTGLDMASGDTRILAGASGVVIAAGQSSTGYGTYVVISHAGGYSSLYGHLSLAMVSVGAPVTQGQQIGVQGSTGMSTGPHLHFEVRLNGTPVDPAPLLPSRGSSG
jgi:murein DD-endopeptidase MepM/ murein hydrolase activator NlpD